MREIYKIYAATLLVGLAGAVAVISTLFYLANGLTQGQIGIILAVSMISLALLEIPTGGFADTFGHKTSVGVGLVCNAIGMLITGLSSNFYMFIFAMLLSGLGFALISGAYSSLIQDILNKLGKSSEFTKVQGRTGSILLAGLVITSPLMSILYKTNIRLPYLIAFVLLIFSAVFMFLVKWEFKGEKPTFGIYFQKVKTGVTAVLKNKAMIGLIVISIGLGSGRSLFNQSINQPFQLSLGIDVALLGTIAAIVACAEAITSAFSHKLFEKISASISLLFIVLVPAILLILLSRIHTLLGLLPIIIFALIHTYRENVVMTLYQKGSSDMERATMVSTTSFLTYIFVGLMLPIGGYGIDLLGIRNILVVVGIITVAISLTGFFIYRKARR